MITVLSFLSLLCLVVVVHEYGHYKVAVLCGVKVLKFSIGFGPALFAWQLRPFRWVRGGEVSQSDLQQHAHHQSIDPNKTLFLCCALPLGGYVHMLDEREGPVQPEFAQMAFNRKPLLARAAVVGAGPLANLLLATALYACLQWVGHSEPAAILGTALPGSAAAQAGLQSGDKVLGIKVLEANALGVNELGVDALRTNEDEPDTQSTDGFQRTPTYAALVQALRAVATPANSSTASKPLSASTGQSQTHFKNPEDLQLNQEKKEIKEDKKINENKEIIENKDQYSPSKHKGLWVELAVLRGSHQGGHDQPADEYKEQSNDYLSLQPTTFIRLDLTGWSLAAEGLQHLHTPSWAQARAEDLQRLGLSGPARAPIINSVLPGGAAQAAGLQPGDEVLMIDGTKVFDAQHLVQRIRSGVQSAPKNNEQSSPDDQIGQMWSVYRPNATNSGLIDMRVHLRGIQEGGQTIGRLDAIIGGEPEMVYSRVGFFRGLQAALLSTWEQALSGLLGIKAILTGELSWHELSGPLTVAQYAGQSAKIGWASFLSFTAFVSVSVGVLNLLPIPVLDGGQLMYYLWEWVSGRAPVLLWQERLTRLGLIMIALMMSAAMFNDLMRLFG